MSSLTMTAPPVFPQSDLETIKRQSARTADEEKARLKKATQEFESFFMYELLKNMRKTIPDNSLTKDSPLSGGMGKETFTDLFDMELGRRVATGGTGSISDILYSSLEKLIDAKYTTGPQDATSVPTAVPTSGPMPIDEPPLPVPKSDAIDISRPERFVPASVTSRPRTGDSIRDAYGSIIDTAAEEHKVDSSLIASVIRAESGGDARAVSSAGAKGLMQLMDSTASDLGVKDAFDPEDNIQGGTKYLSAMLERFGDLKLALAAYNAGPGNVEKYGGIPPFSETRKYVDKVSRLFHTAKQLEQSDRTSVVKDITSRDDI